MRKRLFTCSLVLYFASTLYSFHVIQNTVPLRQAVGHRLSQKALERRQFSFHRSVLMALNDDPLELCDESIAEVIKEVIYLVIYHLQKKS